MERKEFLTQLGISLAAVCAGCSIASCGSMPKQDDPIPEGGTGTGNNGGSNGNSLLDADLSSELKNAGEFKIANGIILVRLSQGSTATAFTAVQAACTHQGVSIGWNTAQGKFVCPAHGSQFDTHGAVLQGPAAIALKEYKVNITGNNLTVTA
ncbi:QcrA and Rieske domain-containing protein [Mucilaginibacter koreensis]